MAFNSFEFILLLLVTLGLYYFLPRALRLVLLLTSSYIFYGSWSAPFLGLIFFSTWLNYASAIWIDRSHTHQRRLVLLLISMTINLGLLGYFKYTYFFLDTFQDTMLLFGREITLPHWHIVLPVGISFYTFQTMSYTLDVYRRKMELCPSLLQFALYVCFFPQLVAGPIERADHLLPQLTIKHPLLLENLSSGVRLLIIGLFKKVLLADNFGIMADVVYNQSDRFSGAMLLLGTYCFAFQIYFDFSAYSTIAQGSARLFGVNLMDNFHFPYLSLNISDFWRRWHISLSTWLRDYLYFPLGGSRKGVPRTILNLFIVMGLGGLWHGSTMNFVVWGLYLGCLLGSYHGLRMLWPEERRAPWLASAPVKLCAWLLTFHCVCVSWVFFRAQTLTEASAILGRIFTLSPIQLLDPFAIILLSISVLLILWQWLDEHHGVLGSVLEHRWLRYPALAAFYLGLAIGPVTESIPFIYFQF